MIRLRSIRHKLLGVVLLTTLMALLVSLGTIITYDLRAYHRNLLADMSTQAELLGHMSSAALAFDDQRLATENLNLLRIRPKVGAGAIYNAAGKLFAGYRQPGHAGAAQAGLQPLPARAGHAGSRIVDGQLVLFKPIIDHGEMVGTVYLSAEYELAGRTFDYLAIGLGVILLALLLAYLILRRLDHVITQPILDIADVAREVIETRDYSRRAHKISDDEVAQLVDSFNQMLAEIEQRTGALERSNAAIASEARQRASAQQEVMRLNEELELRVHERTMQLEMANGELAMAMEEARSANYAKSAFLSSMSHELRTPLNAILGFAQILSSDRLPSTLPQKKEFAGHILKSGRHLLTLINEILDLAKVEAGVVNLSLEPVALGDILGECHSMIVPLAAQRAIGMVFPENCRQFVQADRTRLKQILLNLLSNALKYNRQGGTVQVTCSSNEGRVRIAVRDSGIGLTQQQLAGLFQPFNRLGQEAGQEEGSGIGLVVTKRLAELMHGSIGVDSTPGVGSTFWIELGAAAAPAPTALETMPAAPAGAATFPAAGAPLTLLYVEDNPANLKLVEEIVRFRPGLRLLSAMDGRLGVEMARRHLPQLILMDINLPGLGGDAALKILRADPRTAHIPVIALTANAMARDIEQGLRSGFARYLTKPINIDEFTEAINATLGAPGASSTSGAMARHTPEGSQ